MASSSVFNGYTKRNLSLGKEKLKSRIYRVFFPLMSVVRIPSTNVLQSEHTHWQVTRWRRGRIHFIRCRDVDWHGFQVHSGIAAHCHCGWLRCWFCNSISLRRKALEQQGTFNFSAQVGVSFVYSGISCTATQVDTPADQLVPRLARDEIAVILIVHVLLVRFDFRWKTVFLNFLSSVGKKGIARK